MKTYEPKDFNEICEKAVKNTFTDAQARVTSLEKQRRFAPTFRRLSYFYQCTLWALGGSAHFDVEAEEIKEIEPALRLLEEECGVEFESGGDSATANYASRAYKTKCGTLVVNVSLKTNGKGCRSVKVGEELVPKYKLVCDDDPAVPPSPAIKIDKSQDDIPF